MPDRLDSPELHCRIERLRKDLNMTQPEFAEALGMEGKKGRSTINNWESGANKIKDNDLKHIAQTFGVSSDWLLGLVGIDEKKPSTEIRAMRDYTGLNDSALNLFHLLPQVAKILNLLSSSPDVVVRLCNSIDGLYDCAARLTSALDSGDYNYEELKKDANTCLFEFEDSMRQITIYKGVGSLRDRLQSPFEYAMTKIRKEASDNGEHQED